MLVILEPLARLLQQLLECFSLFDVKEIQVVVRIRHIIETDVRLEVLASQKLLARANLIEELIQDDEVLEVARDLIALDRKIFVRAPSQDLQHAAFVFFEDLQRLLAVVDGADAPLEILLLDLGLVLLERQMRQLDDRQAVVRGVQLVENERL